MKELRDILEAVDHHAARGEKMALATIVGVRGSTYRREGARLLVWGQGGMVGNISGGCLEGDIAVVAGEVLRTGTPRLAAYDLTADDDMVWGLGLGCNGAVDVLVEPVATLGGFLQTVRHAIDEEATLVLAVVVRGTGSVPVGTRLAAHPDGRVDGAVADAVVADRLRRALDSARREGRSRRQTVASTAGDLDVFIEVLRPAIRVIIVGAGHDAVPVVAQAAALGWRVTVADNREAYLTGERFPGAGSFLQTPFGDAAARMPIDERTAVVVMTHNYLNDRAVLSGLLRRSGPPPFYLGMLGPRTRMEKMLAELQGEGVTMRPETHSRLHGPVGLDVGSEGPEEIAVAVVAEILAVDRARGGGFLRDRPGSIHAVAP